MDRKCVSTIEVLRSSSKPILLKNHEFWENNHWILYFGLLTICCLVKFFPTSHCFWNTSGWKNLILILFKLMNIVWLLMFVLKLIGSYILDHFKQFLSLYSFSLTSAYLRYKCFLFKQKIHKINYYRIVVIKYLIEKRFNFIFWTILSAFCLSPCFALPQHFWDLSALRFLSLISQKRGRWKITQHNKTQKVLLKVQNINFNHF